MASNFGTLREHAHGGVLAEKGQQDLYYTVTTDSGQWLCMTEKLRFSFSRTTGFHYVSSFSICPFIPRCLDISGRACVLPLPWLYQCVLMAVRRDRLCIVLGRVACQLSWMALAEFCFSVLTSAVCEVFGSHVKPYTDKFRIKKKKSFFHNISIKIHLSPNVDHPRFAVSVWRVSSQWKD